MREPAPSLDHDLAVQRGGHKKARLPAETLWRRSGDVLRAAAGLRAVLPLAAALASAWRLGKLAAGPTCPTCQPQLRTAAAAPRLGASSFLDR